MFDRDRGGFEQFVLARRAALVRSAYLLVGNQDDAEDLIQVSLAKAVGHWTKIAERPEPYVRQIMARESISRWRRRRWREIGTDQLPDSSARTEDLELRLSIRQALSALTPKQRAVIVLRFYDDLTERETAAMLGVSMSTVKSTARDALAKLGAQPGLEDTRTGTRRDA